MSDHDTAAVLTDRDIAWAEFRDGPNYTPTDRYPARDAFDAGWTLAHQTHRPCLTAQPSQDDPQPGEVARAIRTLLPGLRLANYVERWSPQSPAVQALNILIEWTGGEPVVAGDEQDPHVPTAHARRPAGDPPQPDERPRCLQCGPGYWIGDPGCQHTGRDVRDYRRGYSEQVDRAEAAEAEVERLTAAISAIHYSVNYGDVGWDWCVHCWTRDGAFVRWPCPTAAATISGPREADQ